MGWGDGEERRVSRKRAGLEKESGVDSWDPVMLALGKLRQKYCEVQANLGQKVRTCLKNEGRGDMEQKGYRR